MRGGRRVTGAQAGTLIVDRKNGAAALRDPPRTEPPALPRPEALSSSRNAAALGSGARRRAWRLARRDPAERTLRTDMGRRSCDHGNTTTRKPAAASFRDLAVQLPTRQDAYSALQNRHMSDPLTCMTTAGHPVDGVLHVGVRADQPLPDYRACGASPCIYVDPEPATHNRLADQFADDPWHIAVAAACSDRSGDVAPGDAGLDAPPVAPESVDDRASALCTIDDLVENHSPRRCPNLLVIDVPGSELHILQGALRTLASVDGVFLSVSEAPLHPGGCTLTEIQIFLIPYGLLPRWLELDRFGRGRAFFSRPAPEAEILPTYGGNVALGKWAAQSSLSEWSRPTMAEEAGQAVNGQITGDCSFHTDIEDNPWWFVDLGQVHTLTELRIYNRPGPYRARARTLKVLTSRDSKTWQKIHDQAGYSFGGVAGRPLRILLEQHPARYIALRLAERTCLHLDEVEIY